MSKFMPGTVEENFINFTIKVLQQESNLVRLCDARVNAVTTAGFPIGEFVRTNRSENRN